MNIRVLCAAVIAVTLAVSQASAECTYPKAPASTPDGATASKEEMVAGMAAVKEYNTKVSEYLECLDKETAERIAAEGPDAPETRIAQIKNINAKRQEAAQLELQTHVDRFNEQVKLYKAKEKE